MKVVTGEEMRKIDSYTINNIGVPGVILMEHAGQEVTKVILEALADEENRVVILAGRGNNGGDGFVVSRLLAGQGIKVETILLGRSLDITGDAKINLDILKNLNENIFEATMKVDLDKVEEKLKGADLVVDALLGTGIRGRLRGLYPELIRMVNKSDVKVVAVDIPSGVEAATGKVEDIAIRAEKTVTFGLPKIGTLLYPGVDYVGKLKVVDIGLSKEGIDKQNIKVNLITEDIVKEILPIRVGNSHKGTYGKLLVVAGSVGMTGAATLAGLASLKVGAGLVTVGVPARVNQIMEEKLTEAMTYPLTDIKEGTLAKESLKEIKSLLKNRDALAIGPGLQVTEEISYVVNQLLKEVEKPMIIDADGLNVIDLELLKKREGVTILTPHPGELARLTGKSIEEIEADRLKIASDFALEYGVILLLKGARSIIATSEGVLYINQMGNSGMATGGSGDVLTGLIAGLIVQNINPMDAVIIATYLHGLAGDLAAVDLTEYSLLPTDLLDYLPKAVRVISDE